LKYQNLQQLVIFYSGLPAAQRCFEASNHSASGRVSAETQLLQPSLHRIAGAICFVPLLHLKNFKERLKACYLQQNVSDLLH
jgi:hypothetical protein